MSIADRLRNAGGDVDPPIKVRRLGEQDWLILDGRHRWVGQSDGRVRGHPRDGGAMSAYHLCPAPVPGVGGPICLAPLPCEEHGVPDANAAWVLYGNAYTEERTVHGWGGWPGWVALGCIAGITVLTGGALCAGLIVGAVRRWRERG